MPGGADQRTIRLTKNIRLRWRRKAGTESTAGRPSRWPFCGSWVSIRDWFGRTWLLCGTPAPNTAHDIIAEVTMVDFGETFADVRVPEDRAEAVAVVRHALEERAIYLRNLKVDVLPDLPERSFTRLSVPLAPLQSRLYDAALGELVAEVEAVDDRQFLRQLSTFLARRMALLRITSNPSGVFDTYDELPGKLVALDELVERLVVGDGEKLVVWSCFTASLDAIVRRYSAHGTVRYDGSVTSIEDRREAVRRFQNDPEARIFVANPAAAGAGLTLHAALLRDLRVVHQPGRTVPPESRPHPPPRTDPRGRVLRTLGRGLNRVHRVRQPRAEGGACPRPAR